MVATDRDGADRVNHIYILEDSAEAFFVTRSGRLPSISDCEHVRPRCSAAAGLCNSEADYAKQSERDGSLPDRVTKKASAESSSI